jgi:hypothetical protein
VGGGGQEDRDYNGGWRSENGMVWYGMVWWVGEKIEIRMETGD